MELVRWDWHSKIFELFNNPFADQYGPLETIQTPSIASLKNNFREIS